MSEAYLTEDYKGYQIEIHQDIDPENPREWENLFTVVGWSRRYNLTDPDFQKQINFSDPEEFLEWWKLQGGGVIHNLFMFDHGALAFSISSFGDPWDSGQVGFMFATNAKIREWFNVKKITKAIREKVEENLKAEIKTLNAWNRGDYCGYVVEGLDMGSCWGFETSEDAIAAAKEEIDGEIEMIEGKRREATMEMQAALAM